MLSQNSLVSHSGACDGGNSSQNSATQTKHTLEQNKDLWSLQIVFEFHKKTRYSINVCRKGWLLTLTAGLLRKKSKWVRNLKLCCAWKDCPWLSTKYACGSSPFPFNRDAC